MSLWPHSLRGRIQVLCLEYALLLALLLAADSSIGALHRQCAGGFGMRGTLWPQTTFYPCGGHAAKHLILYAL